MFRAKRVVDKKGIFGRPDTYFKFPLSWGFLEDQLNEAHIYAIPVENIAKMERKLNAINNKAAKNKSGGVEYDVIGSRREKEMITRDEVIETRDGGTELLRTTFWTGRYFYYSLVRIKGTYSRVGGWQVVAALDVNENGAMIRSTPGNELPKKYRDYKGGCDHCKKKRKRAAHVVLKHEDGRLAVVGKSCLKDFVNGEDIDRLIWALQITNWDVSGGSARDTSYDLREVVAWSIAVVRRWGWVSRGAAKTAEENGGGMESTASRVALNMDPVARAREIKDAARNGYEPELIDPPSKGDLYLASEAIAWAAGLDRHKVEQYLANLYWIAQNGRVEDKQYGLAVSMASAAKRAKEGAKAYEAKRKQWAKEKAERAAKSAGATYVGTIKKREVFTLTVVFKYEGEPSEYGPRYLYSFEDKDGNKLTTWTGRDDLADVGDLVEIKATPKKHEVYKEAKQTVLSRVAVERVLWSAEAEAENKYYDDEKAALAAAGVAE